MARDTDSDSDPDSDGGSGDAPPDGDTFGVGIHVTEDELRFLVRVPSDVDSGWTDPDEFQRLVERVVWDRLDRDRVLAHLARERDAGETVSLGTVTLRPDGTVVDHTLDAPGAGG